VLLAENVGMLHNIEPFCHIINNHYIPNS